jgi:hypothetical protein
MCEVGHHGFPEMESEFRDTEIVGGNPTVIAGRRPRCETAAVQGHLQCENN